MVAAGIRRLKGSSSNGLASDLTRHFRLVVAIALMVWGIWSVVWMVRGGVNSHARHGRGHVVVTHPGSSKMRNYIKERNLRRAAWRPPDGHGEENGMGELVKVQHPVPLPRTPPRPPPAPPPMPLGGPSTVCVAWRAYTADSCGDERAVRAHESDGFCTALAKGPGHCEVADMEYEGGEGGTARGAKRATMHRRCGSFPEEVRCEDAAEFDAFKRLSLEYRYPPLNTPVNERQRDTPTRVAAASARGIVIAVHDGLAVSAYATVKLLRHHGCHLPVELWTFPGELTNRHKGYLDELVRLPGVQLRLVSAAKEELCKDPKRCFAIKPYALFHSSFESVLMLDADNFPLRDPTYLFETTEFKSTGALFWPDYWHPRHTIFHVHNASMLWELTGVEYVDMFEQESGQLLVNRATHERAMHIMMFYTLPNNLIWRWGLVWGDKDLYRLAWMRAGASFHMIQTPPGAAGQYAHSQFCGVTIVQHDTTGRPIFFHRNTVKLGLEPASREAVWDGYMVYRGKDPLRRYRVESSGAPPEESHFRSASCFGHRDPATAPEGWQFISLKGHPQLGDLEDRILRYAEEQLPPPLTATTFNKPRTN